MEATGVHSLGAAVRAARRGRGLTQFELARLAGVGRRFIVDLESGHPRAELGKALLVMQSLGLRVTAEPSVVAIVDAPDGPVAFHQVAGPRGRALNVATRLWREASPQAHGLVRLPKHVYWSGGDETFDMTDERDRQLLYRIVLTEGTANDIVTYLDPARLAEMWDSMLLPPLVREAWQPTIDAAAWTKAA